MLRLLSVWKGEAKDSIKSISIIGLFYTTALKSLKRDFSNPLVVSGFNRIWGFGLIGFYLG